MQPIFNAAAIAAVLSLLTGIPVWKFVAAGVLGYGALCWIFVTLDSDGSNLKRWRMWRGKS